ncbi:hypothetical protein LJR168_003909 [Pseudoxanthomonas sp. LjRoot168]|uniref:hypothetical protein n=1 Tax=unclassified Pseudoxanthomonas TaxID=2645906 RepID=UPI003ECE151C
MIAASLAVAIALSLILTKTIHEWFGVTGLIVATGVMMAIGHYMAPDEVLAMANMKESCSIGSIGRAGFSCAFAKLELQLAKAPWVLFHFFIWGWLALWIWYGTWLRRSPPERTESRTPTVT